MGRRAKYGQDVRKIILDRLMAGEALNAICKSIKDGPHESTVRLWVVDDDDGFAPKYMRARDIGYDCRAEQALVNAGKSKDAPLGRLAFDAERWYLGKMKPKTYGDKTLVGSDPDNPLPAGFTVNLVSPVK